MPAETVRQALRFSKPVCRSASKTRTATELDRLRLRAPSRIGMRTQRSGCSTRSGFGQAARLPAEHQVVAVAVLDLMIGVRRLGRRVEVASVRVLFKKILQIFVHTDIEQVPVVQTGALHAPVVELQSRAARPDAARSPSPRRCGRCCRCSAGSPARPERY